MVKEGLEKILPIMQAFVEGKTIQRYDDKKDDWYDVSPNANIDFYYNYRIKPEPKYRAFLSQEECWNEMLKHKPFGWVIETVTNHHKHITTVLDCDIIFYDSTGFKTSFDLMLRDCIFADGTPFGIWEEQQ